MEFRHGFSGQMVVRLNLGLLVELELELSR